MDLFDQVVQVDDVATVSAGEALEEEEFGDNGAIGHQISAQVTSGEGNTAVGVIETRTDDQTSTPTLDVVVDDNVDDPQWEWPPYSYESENMPPLDIANMQAKFVQEQANGQGGDDEEGIPKWEWSHYNYESENIPTRASDSAHSSLAQQQTKRESGYQDEDDTQRELPPYTYESKNIPTNAIFDIQTSLAQQHMNSNSGEESDDSRGEYPWCTYESGDDALDVTMNLQAPLAEQQRNSINHFRDKAWILCLVRLMRKIVSEVGLGDFFWGLRAWSFKRD